jgi:hypothetical protein
MGVAAMSATVTVACKTPNGIMIYGTPVRGFMYDKSEPPPDYIVGGYALTPGIDQDLWNRWLANNQDSDIVQRDLIFAGPDEAQVRAKARSKAPPRQLGTIIQGR